MILRMQRMLEENGWIWPDFLELFANGKQVLPLCHFVGSNVWILFGFPRHMKTGGHSQTVLRTQSEARSFFQRVEARRPRGERQLGCLSICINDQFYR